MKLISLHGVNGQGKFAKVDDEDYEYLMKFRWYGVYIKTSSNYYVLRNSEKESTRMHVLIFGKKEGYVIDHIDGDGLNNQKSNLRHCTFSENGYNRKNYRNTLSKYKGVCKKGNKWVSRIQKDKKQYNLGTFESQELAAEAYNKAAKELFGEFAQLNCLNGGTKQGIIPPIKKERTSKPIPVYEGELPPNSRAIPLTKGKFTIVSEEDYESLNKLKWLAIERTKNTFYAYRSGKRLGGGKREKGVGMHTFLMKTPKGKVVDHINRNTLDNRRCNLRIVTQKVNIHNTSRSLRNSRYSIQLKLI